MGYLWMAMIGLSVLVVTWTTVVLLGGFVSMLGKEDFWCLTVITLVQTAGVFNMHLSNKLTAMPRLCLGFLDTIKITVTRQGGQARSNERACIPCLPAPSGRFSVKARNLMGFVVELVQGMVFAIILCPLAALYGLGLYITSTISLRRLVHHDYGSSEGGGANKNPALYVLYILAVFQGTVYAYRVILGRAGKRIAKQVAEEYKFLDHSPVLRYLDEVRIGCEKDTSFCRGRNLITYALDLMELESPDDLLSGTRIMDTLITYDENLTQGDQLQCRRMPMVIERLIGSSCSGKIFQKLLKALDSRSSGDREMRERAARIVLSLAGDIRLKQFPGGIESICSLLDTSQREVKGYKELMRQGLHIIEKLATDEDNCRVMSDAYGLVSMTMAPLSCDLLHRFNRNEWSAVVNASLQVMCTWLETATGNSVEKLCSQITLNEKAVRTMEAILVCDECHQERQILAMKVLITQIQDQENIIVQLLGIFTDFRKDDYITVLAGERLLMLSKESKSNAKIILEANNGSVEAIVSFVNTEGDVRICAAGILEGLCSHYTANDDCFEDMKILILTALMPNVLTEILPRSMDGARIASYVVNSLPVDVLRTLTSEALQTLTYEEVRILLHGVLKIRPHEVQTNIPNDFLQKFLHETVDHSRHEEVRKWLHKVLQKIPSEALLGLPLEDLQILVQILPRDALQNIHPSVEKEINTNTVEWRETKKLEVAMLSLWLMVYDKVITPGTDLPPLFTKVASRDRDFNYPRRLMQMVERNRVRSMDDCLRILKLVAKMTISMMRHKHIYIFNDLETLIASLKDASRIMINLEAFVHLSGGDGDVTLGSLVQEARKLLYETDEAQPPEDKKKGKEPEIGPFEHGPSSSS